MAENITLLVLTLLNLMIKFFAITFGLFLFPFLLIIGFFQSEKTYKETIESFSKAIDEAKLN
jgi:hypothetical protein